MQKLIVLMAVLAVCLARPATQQQDDNNNNNNNVSSTAGLPFNEEIVVESSLYVRNKSNNRQKRQFNPGFGGGPGFGAGPYGQSSALANANSYGQYQRPGGFGAGSGIAGAQAFNAQGPMGGFGATATNAGTQGFDCQYGAGCTGSAGMSGGQTYDLPGGKHVNINYGGAFSGGPQGGSGGQSHTIGFS